MSLGLAAGETQLELADAHDVTDRQLLASACLRFSVDGHLVCSKECLCLSAAVDQPGELQQLAERDHRTSDWHVALDRAKLPSSERPSYAGLTSAEPASRSPTVSCSQNASGYTSVPVIQDSYAESLITWKPASGMRSDVVAYGHEREAGACLARGSEVIDQGGHREAVLTTEGLTMDRRNGVLILGLLIPDLHCRRTVPMTAGELRRTAPLRSRR
jgi:hypothetical protein